MSSVERGCLSNQTISVPTDWTKAFFFSGIQEICILVPYVQTKVILCLAKVWDKVKMRLLQGCQGWSDSESVFFCVYPESTSLLKHLGQYVCKQPENILGPVIIQSSFFLTLQHILSHSVSCQNYFKWRRHSKICYYSTPFYLMCMCWKLDNWSLHRTLDAFMWTCEISCEESLWKS